MSTSLWRDRNSKLLLAGSVHFLPPSHAMPRDIIEAYEQASRVVFESRLDQKRNFNLGSIPGMTTLEDILDASLFSAVRALAEELGTDFESLKPLRPWAVALDLAPLLAKSYGATADLGIDKQLFDQALREQKPVDFLEHIDFLPRRLNADGLAVQIEFLRQFIAGKEDGIKWYLALIDAWHRGDVLSLDDIQKRQFGPFPRVTDLVLRQRNRNWLTRLREYRKSKSSVLVIVGCFHLVGEGSLRQLLEQRGAEFEQL